MPHSFYFRTNDGVGSAAQSGVDVGSTLALAKPAPSLTRHEAFVPPEQFAKKGNIPLELAENIVYKAHTPPDMLGLVFDIARPVLGVGTHYFQDDDLIDAFFEGIATTYDGPVALAQDLMVFNVTPEQIVLRMAKTEQLWWAPEDPEAEGGETTESGYTSPARTPDWLAATKIE